MFDLELVKMRYARMENEELLYLAHHNHYGLSTEAISALYKEFLKRDLDISVFPELRASRIVKPSKEEETIQEDKNAYIAHLQEKCLRDISNGQTLDEVFNNLQKAGLRNGESLYIINSLQDYTKDLENNNDIEMMTGAAVCLLGVFLIALLSSTENQDFSYTGLILIFIGVIRMIIGFNKNSNHIKEIKLFKETKMPYVGNMEEKSIIKK